MKDDLTNIINFENLTRVRNSIGANANMPAKNSLVKIIPLEFLEKGIKVLIDGKLFIAFIDGKIPVKEELIAYVTSTSPFSLSLDFSSQLNNKQNYLVEQIIRKFKLRNNDLTRNAVIKVIEDGNILIKSKIILLTELLGYLKVSGLELSLLVNIIWTNNDKNRNFIVDLYENLFNESFEEVCKNIFNSVTEILFLDLPQYISQQIRDYLIYPNDKMNSDMILNKINSFVELIKILNEYKISSKYNHTDSINGFIENATKYILQKSVLKEYDYFPDFIITNKETELTIIHYSIIKIINSKNHISYKILFKHDTLPFLLSGVIRDNFLFAELETDKSLIKNDEVDLFQEDLLNHWGFRSDIKINDEETKNKFIPKLNVKINKLVS